MADVDFEGIAGNVDAKTRIDEITTMVAERMTASIRNGTAISDALEKIAIRMGIERKMDPLSVACAMISASMKLLTEHAGGALNTATGEWSFDPVLTVRGISEQVQVIAQATGEAVCMGLEAHPEQREMLVERARMIRARGNGGPA